MFEPSLEEQVAASAVAALGGDRCDCSLMLQSNREKRSSPADAAGDDGNQNKRVRNNKSPATVVEVHNQQPAATAEEAAATAEAAAKALALADRESGTSNGKTGEDLKPHPFFYYVDHSKDKDPDSLTPLTPPGRVPNFPAKMHSILSRPDLADIM